MPPVSPGSASAFGSVFADAPGMIRENGYTFQYTLSPSAANADLPICSATSPTPQTDGQVSTVLAPLTKGDTLLIYGVQGACATLGSAGVPMAFSVRVGSHNATDPMLCAGTANANGPWFQHLIQPIAIEGPETGTKEVWLECITPSAGTAGQRRFNRVTLELVLVKARG